jgi:hypothetical protein
MNKALKVMMMGCSAAILVACGGGDGPPLASNVATQDLAVNVTTAVMPAVVNVPFEFPNGVAEFGTTGPVRVAFTSTDAAPTFRIETGGTVATGTTTFGSCIFNITSSTTGFLSAGKTIRVDPCTLTIGTNGLKTSFTGNVNVTLLLGTKRSIAVPVPFTLGDDGKVRFKDTEIGTVTVVAVTGGGN